MDTLQIKCSSCGAPITTEINTGIIKCPYCGCTITVDSKILEQKRLVDKQKLEERIVQQEYELQKNDEIKKSKILKIKIIATIVFGLMAVIGYGAGFSGSGNSGLMMIGILGLLGVVYVWILGSNKKEKKNSYKRLNPDYAEITDDIVNCKDENYANIAAKIKSHGFTNVECIPLCDLNFFTKGISGKIENISINGEMNIEGGYYPKDSYIVINYHSGREK